MKKYWIEMQPEEFTEAVKKAPVAYLPLGTLEWHGYHMPLGADGLQAIGMFERLAEDVGGVIMPMLFLGPDRTLVTEEETYHGMDICRENRLVQYENRKQPGSAYWMSDEMFDAMILQIAENVSRQGIKILMAHGHGPSIRHCRDLEETVKEKYGLDLLTGMDVFSGQDAYMADHAAANETSITMTLYPELVDLNRLHDLSDCVGMIGRNPIEYAGTAYGTRLIEENRERYVQELKKRIYAIQKENR